MWCLRHIIISSRKEDVVTSLLFANIGCFRFSRDSCHASVCTSACCLFMCAPISCLICVALIINPPFFYNRFSYQFCEIRSSQYRVIHKSLGDFRPLRYSSRDGHAEREHANTGGETPSFCPTLQVLICSFLLCRLWLLRSRVRKFRRDLQITLYFVPSSRLFPQISPP
jgi:hypothetical protein